MLYIMNVFRDDDHDWTETVQIRRMNPMLAVLRDARDLKRVALELKIHIQKIERA